MKRTIFLLTFILLALTSCHKELETDQLIPATIIGYDLRLCACCGGLLINFDPLTNDVYQWYQKSGDLGVTPKDTFPLKVKIRYHHLINTCVASKGEIEINELKKI